MTDIKWLLAILSVGVLAYSYKCIHEAHDSYWSGQCLKKEAEQKTTEQSDPPTEGDEWKKV